MAAFAWRATRRECFLPGWSNQVLTRDCQSLRKWLRWRTLSVGSRGQFKLSYQCLECPRERWETDLFLPNWRSTTATATTAATTAGARQAGGRAGQRGVHVKDSVQVHVHPWQLAVTTRSTQNQKQALASPRPRRASLRLPSSTRPRRSGHVITSLSLLTDLQHSKAAPHTEHAAHLRLQARVPVSLRHQDSAPAKLTLLRGQPLLGDAAVDSADGHPSRPTAVETRRRPGARTRPVPQR